MIGCPTATVACGSVKMAEPLVQELWALQVLVEQLGAEMRDADTSAKRVARLRAELTWLLRVLQRCVERA